MPETRPVPLHRSVFVRLLSIMVAMALLLMLMVIGFFVFVVNPGVREAVDSVLAAYAQSLAAGSPAKEDVQEVAHRLGITIAYDGPAGGWTTGRSSDVSPAAGWAFHRHELSASDGGTYTVSWEFGQSMKAAHDRLLALLLVLMLAVVVLAHEVLRRALRPVRLLCDGVARVGQGDLDVEVPRQSRDELGVLTDAFNEMARRVKDMIKLREELLQDVSHELRSPLTRMKVALALVPEGSKRAQMEADVVEMETMITGILELERIREGSRMRIEQRDLAPLLRDAASAFAATAPGVRLVLPKGEIPLPMDDEKVRVVLRNVLENAVKYSLPDSAPVEISVTMGPDAVVLRIRDDGQGIAALDRPRIFEPFYRADRSRSRKTGGYGLGLSLARRIMEAHGGTIAAEDDSPRGATFVLTFPR